MKHIINKKQVVQIIVKKHFTVPLTRGTIHKTHDKKGSLSNGVDDLENFTSEMESRFLLELNEMPNEDGRGAIAFVRNVFNFLYARNFSFLDMVLLN